jgi:integrase
MRDVKRPSAGQTEAKHLTTQETLTLLAAAEGMRYKMAFELMAVTGMRRGETLALTWDNIDLEKGTVKVRATLSRVDGKLIVGSPKTAKSHRDIPLTENMVLALKQHRKGQVAEQLKAGSQWQNKGLVFSTELGGYVDPRNLLRGLNIAARKAGLEGIGLHTLRHSAATAMLEANTPILNVSRMLGHSSIAITIDLYGHVNDESMRQAINGLSKALGF